MSDVKDLIERLLDYHAHDMSDELAADAATALERLSAERDAAMEALKPFAAFAPEAEAFVERAAATPGRSPIMPATKAFRLADFRRAVAALKAEPVEP